jgi:hypothetical protein
MAGAAGDENGHALLKRCSVSFPRKRESREPLSV